MSHKSSKQIWAIGLVAELVPLHIQSEGSRREMVQAVRLTVCYNYFS